MKKLINLLAPIIFSTIITSCESVKPKEKDFLDEGYSISYINGSKVYLKDFDKDGKVDAMTYPGKKIIQFYAKGYENAVVYQGLSEEMSPKLRKAASDAFKSNKTLDYEVAKANYESK